MKRMQLKHWQDPVSALLGAWFALSPWALNYQDNDAALAASVALGLGLVTTSLLAMFESKPWEHWIAGAIGVGVLASPWLLGFAEHAVASRNAMVVGLLSFVLASWVLAREHGGSDWGRDGLAR